MESFNVSFMPTMAMRKDLVVFSFLVSLLHSIQNVSASVNLISVQEHTFHTWYAFINIFDLYSWYERIYTEYRLTVFKFLLQILIYNSANQCWIFSKVSLLSVDNQCDIAFEIKMSNICVIKSFTFLPPFRDLPTKIHLEVK